MTERTKLICRLAKIIPLPFKAIGIIADKLLEHGMVITIRCKDCTLKEPSDLEGRVWCKRMGRYMKVDGYCSEGEHG